jgi:hypothetical protein
MNPSKILCVMAFGLSAAACTTYSSTTTQAVADPGPVVLTSSEQACVDYGFTPSTVGYDRCVSREHEARLRGRVVATYSQAQLADDARAACYSYGLERGTARFDRCVGREIDARAYRGSVAYTNPGTGYTTVTTYSSQAVDPAPYYTQPAKPTPPAGVQAFRDEYGFRYDGQGNRLDRNGNIVSPHSTQP